jgi:hypothetical protein
MLELFRGAKTAAHSKHICDLHNNTKEENKQRNLSGCSIIYCNMCSAMQKRNASFTTSAKPKPWIKVIVENK